MTWFSLVIAVHEKRICLKVPKLITYAIMLVFQLQTMQDTFWNKGVLNPQQQGHIRVTISSNDGNEGICHTKQMEEVKKNK